MKLDSLQVTQCGMQARLFEQAFRRGYDMAAFAFAFLHSRAAAGLDADAGRYTWLGDGYILEDVTARAGLVPAEDAATRAEDFDGIETARWAGWLWRHWNYYTGESSREIFNQADWDLLAFAYPGYHALSCEMAVDRIKRNRLARGLDAGRLDHCPDHELEVFAAKRARLARETPAGAAVPSPLPLEDADYAAAGFPRGREVA